MQKKRRTRTEDSVDQGGRGTGSTDDDLRVAAERFDRAPQLVRPQLIVFASTDHVGGAQIAVAWFQMLADPMKARAVLASLHGAPRILPEVVAALRESGRDLKSVYTRALTPQLLTAADLVVTMGGSFDRGDLGTDPPIRREHWLVPDPIGADSLDRARSLRDLVRSRVAMLVFMEGWGRADISRELARVTRPRWADQAFASS